MNKLIATILMALCATAHAEFRDGNKLLSDLRSSGMDRILALGYVMGVSDAGRSVSSCPPETATAGQMADMVQKHLEAMPSLRHLAGDQHVRYVLATTWPCEKKSTTPGRAL